jgi:hypothetical protein
MQQIRNPPAPDVDDLGTNEGEDYSSLIDYCAVFYHIKRSKSRQILCCFITINAMKHPMEV